MSFRENITIGVIGSGRMGTDIANFLSDQDFRLVWICLGEEERSSLEKAFNTKIQRQLRNGLIDNDTFQNRIDVMRISSAPGCLSECDIIIEAIQENAPDKANLFMEIGPFLRDDAILVSNTSSIKPSFLISDESLKRRFAGLHFFYPLKLKNIVELILTDATDAKTLDVLRKFTESIGKFRLEMHENDGFVLNRIFLDFQTQAFLFHHDEGIEMRVIDEIIRMNIFPVGVFEFFDAVGIDVMRQSIINYTENMPGRDFYKTLIDYLENLLTQKRAGKKYGAGFYDYSLDQAPVILPGEELQRTIVTLLQSLYINSVFKALEKNIWSREDLEYAVTEYMGADRDPFAIADEMGHASVKDILSLYYKKTGFEAYRPSILL